ncbi:MAG: substrate-binding domain-containing protein, partial [Candidatus Binatia bacterium]
MYLDQELVGSHLSAKQIAGYATTVSTHLEVGLQVLRGLVDTGLATWTTAQLLGLDFIALTRERFDMLVTKDRFFTPGIQALLGIVCSREFRERVGALGGYDLEESGRIITTN